MPAFAISIRLCQKVNPLNASSFETTLKYIIVFLLFAVQNAPQGAAVPALGLSNKPIYHVEEQKAPQGGTSKSDLYAENHFTPTLLNGNDLHVENRE